MRRLMLDMSQEKLGDAFPGFAARTDDAPSPAYVSDFLATSDGLGVLPAIMTRPAPGARVECRQARSCLPI